MTRTTKKRATKKTGSRKTAQRQQKDSELPEFEFEDITGESDDLDSNGGSKKVCYTSVCAVIIIDRFALPLLLLLLFCI